MTITAAMRDDGSTILESPKASRKPAHRISSNRLTGGELATQPVFARHSRDAGWKVVKIGLTFSQKGSGQLKQSISEL